MFSRVHPRALAASVGTCLSDQDMASLYARDRWHLSFFTFIIVNRIDQIEPGIFCTSWIKDLTSLTQGILPRFVTLDKLHLLWAVTSDPKVVPFSV